MGVLIGRGFGYDDFDVPVNEAYTFENGGDQIAYQEFVEEMVDVHRLMYALDMTEINIRGNNNNAFSLESCSSYDQDRYESVCEATMREISDKIKSSLKQLWEKMKGFFKSVRKYFDYLFMSCHDFLKKYEKDILQAASRADSDFEFKMPNFNDSNINGVGNNDPYTKLNSKIDEYCGTQVEANKKDTAADGWGKTGLGTEAWYLTVNDDQDKLEKRIYEKYRGKIINNNDNGIDSKDYAEQIYGYFRNGAKDSSDTVDKKATDISSMVTAIKENKKLSNDLKKSNDEMDRNFKNIIKEVDDLNKKVSSGDEAKEYQKYTQWLTRKSTIFSKCQSIASTFMSGWRTAIKDRDKYYKAACMAVMRYRNKPV